MNVNDILKLHLLETYTAVVADSVEALVFTVIGRICS